MFTSNYSPLMPSPNNQCKQIFIAATRQNDGKTMVSLGLFNEFNSKFNRVGYMKPVGQQYQLINGEMIDKDALLFQKVYQLKDNLKLTILVSLYKLLMMQ